MLKNSSILKVASFFYELLKIVNIFALFALFCTKYYVYSVKEKINNIEKHIIIAKEEQNNLFLEIDYLTNPIRLKNIYDILNKSNKLNMQYTKIGQEINMQEFRKFLKEKGSK